MEDDEPITDDRFEILEVWHGGVDAPTPWADFDRYGIPFYLLYRPGKEPHLFGELLTKEGLIETVEAAVRVAEAGLPPSRP